MRWSPTGCGAPTSRAGSAAGDGARIDPLTITDACSRYLLRSQAVEKTDTERVRAIFEAAFREYGLPEAIRTDNGAPFAVFGRRRAVAAGGVVDQAGHRAGTHPGRPSGAERPPRAHASHAEAGGAAGRGLAGAATGAGPFSRTSTTRCGRTRRSGMQTPASVYEPSPRPYPARLPEIEYPDSMEVRTIKSHGHFRWKKQDIFLTEVLWGEPIGLLPVGDGRFTVYFAHLPLVGFDSRRGKLVQMNKSCTGRKTKTKTFQRRKNKNCQGCARSEMSGLSPAVQGVRTGGTDRSDGRHFEPRSIEPILHVSFIVRRLRVILCKTGCIPSDF